MLALTERYANIIIGQMYGHLHEDIFTLMKSHQGQNINVVYTNPSLTTFTYLNPAFRVYSMESSTFKLLDYTQYYLNLEKSNKEKVPDWQISYNFTDLFQVPSLSVRSHEIALRKMKVEKGPDA